ncbi:MAG TPA: deoxyguanosinetriphosphate triphosphohydrolase, partial [bacterium]|nr:deoxyguanosinetriphosphate triphosphohydrolase [bacterium]
YILRKIFKAFEKHYLTNDNQTSMTLLPDHTEQPVRAEKEVKKRARLICDYVTGMTDGFALRTYKRLYDPDFGSIMDLV